MDNLSTKVKREENGNESKSCLTGNETFSNGHSLDEDAFSLT